MVESRRKTRPDFLMMRMLERERDEALGDFIAVKVLDMAFDDTSRKGAFLLTGWRRAMRKN